ncbi:MAG: tagaturonate reductase [Saonia sp.]
MKQLNRANAHLQYERPIKILQFGEGNFLRGFVDWIIDLLNEKTDFSGDIQIVQPIEKGLASLINEQDGLYHVIVEGILNNRPIQDSRLITCVRGAIDPYENYTDYLALGENPHLKFIISNTTEAGITFDENDSDPKTLPRSFPGKLAALLYHRYTCFKGSANAGLTILPCELIEKNGEKLIACILQYCDYWKLPHTFKDWVLQHVISYNTLVDRIVPGFPKESILEIQKRIGFEDKLVVKTEPFHLWVIEGPDDIQEILPFEKAGLNVKFVDDLGPYRTQKVRILNGAHTAMVPIAFLKGLRTVKDSIENDEIGTLVHQIIAEEIIPTIDLPEHELRDFTASVMERFKNPFVTHELISISLNAISKFKVRVMPSLLENLKSTRTLPKGLIKAFSYLLVFYKGTYGNVEIPLNDDPEVIAYFSKAWNAKDLDSTIHTLLCNEAFWGQDLTKIEGFGKAVKIEITEILSIA